MANVHASQLKSPPKRSLERPDDNDVKKVRTASHGKRVKFVDAKVVLYHKDLPPVTRFGGLHAPKSAAHVDDERKGRELTEEMSLAQVHAAELREMIQHLGCGIEPLCKCNDSGDSLRAQFRLMQEIHAEAIMEFGDFTRDVLGNNEGASPWLARKDMSGFEGMGYTFGHRFVTIEQYIATLEDTKLVHVLKDHQVSVPPFVIPKSGKRVPVSRLVALHFLNGGRTLDQLTLDELKLECMLRNMTEVASSRKHKKSQLVRILKPIFEEEYLTRQAEMEQREQMEFLVSNLLREAAESKMMLCVAKTLHRRLDQAPDTTSKGEEGAVAPTATELSTLFAKLVGAKHPEANCVHCVHQPNTSN
ncbi:Aste57867_37 [Aphanomyces stellatus]|uniref:Aste57867_37 protein n=1 Tax=Aphanomyces stellatus TaxID=120398 RepID=A0A485K6I5_9STRA|nr:hypothetical protein As57867_000037 [Aphanomyces stellatus]VFT77263.1 Aste57867_37 [Aphanomyces stellatus]